MIIDSKEKTAEGELLPNYDTVVGNQSIRRNPPHTPVIYRFTSWSQNSMLLMPDPSTSAPAPLNPRDPNANHAQQHQHQQQPLYRITVELDLNPFLPISYVTKVFRCGDPGVGLGPGGGGGGRGVNGASRSGTDLVGEFAIGLNGPGQRAVISLGDISARLSKALFSVNSNPRHFNWILGERLHWDCRETLQDGSPMCICYLPTRDPSSTSSSSSTHSSSSQQTPSESIHLATFVPPPPNRSPPLPDATLTVFRHGHRLMDEIVVSALVVERMLNR